jgi:PAS domain S-box-containing protein
VLRYGEGAAGTVAETGEPLLIDDYRTWSKRAAAFEQDQPFHAVLSVPMVWKGQVIGVIHVLDTEERRFRQDDLELLGLFASHAAIAVENTRLFNSLQAELAERGRLEAEIEQRRLYLESLLASAPDAIVTLDSRHKIAEWNPGAERLFGYTADEVRGRDLDELVTGPEGPTREQAMSFTRKVLAGEPVPATEVIRYRKDGSPVHVIVAGSPIVMAGELLGVMATYTDLGELKSAEEALRRSEARYRSLFEDSPISLWEEDWSKVKAYVDDLRSRGVRDLASYLEDHPEEVQRFPDWVKVLDVNRASLQLYGAASKEELIAGLGQVLGPAAVSAHADSLLAIAEGRTHFEHEIVNHTLSGERKLMQVTVQVMPGYEGTWEKVLVSLVDVTERELTEAALHASLQEKEMLLREVHHRVKNTLQIVSSLLYLQSEKAGEGSARDVLQNSRNQVRSMALVHEKLYRSEDLARVDFGEYVGSLRTSLLQTYGTASRGIEVKVDVDAVLLDVDLATPCGLIINELVSNALKHAFTGREEGEVGIGFYADGDQYVLTVRDDGIGLSEGVDLQEAQSLGLQVVGSLVEQLKGTVQVDRHAGSRFTITFPAPRDQVTEGAAS